MEHGSTIFRIFGLSQMNHIPKTEAILTITRLWNNETPGEDSVQSCSSVQAKEFVIRFLNNIRDGEEPPES
jgi:hypothetical protein